MKESIIQQVRGMTGLTRYQVYQRWVCGAVSDRVWWTYLHAWNWSAPRFGGTIGMKHDAYLAIWGWRRYERKINTVRKVLGMEPYYKN